MSAKHTPGPWTIRTLENFGFNVVHYVDGDRFNIHRVAKTGDEANARLIAAAPDLLAALATFVAEYVEMVESGDAGFWDAETEAKVIAARAAISKAEGNP